MGPGSNTMDRAADRARSATLYHAGLARVNRGRRAEFQVRRSGPGGGSNVCPGGPQPFFSFTRFTRMIASDAVAEPPVSVIMYAV